MMSNESCSDIVAPLKLDWDKEAICEIVDEPWRLLPQPLLNMAFQGTEVPNSVMYTLP